MVHKVIAFYLENRDEVDRYVAECHNAMSLHRKQTEQSPSLTELRQRLASMQDAGAS